MSTFKKTDCKELTLRYEVLIPKLGWSPDCCKDLLRIKNKSRCRTLLKAPAYRSWLKTHIGPKKRRLTKLPKVVLPFHHWQPFLGFSETVDPFDHMIHMKKYWSRWYGGSIALGIHSAPGATLYSYYDLVSPTAASFYSFGRRQAMSQRQVLCIDDPMELGRSLGASFQGFERLPGQELGIAGRWSTSRKAVGMNKGSRHDFWLFNNVYIRLLWLNGEWLNFYWDLPSGSLWEFMGIQDSNGKTLSWQVNPLYIYIIIYIYICKNIYIYKWPFSIALGWTSYSGQSPTESIWEDLHLPRLCFEWRRAFHLLPLGLRYYSGLHVVHYIHCTHRRNGVIIKYI